MSINARSIIDAGRMGPAQWLIILITMGLNAMDGFDVLAISFASPGIAHDWGVDKATLGWILSMELLGMAIGSVILGGFADRFGRRPTVLGCLVGMAVGMYGASVASDVPHLLFFRLLTGIGIGGVLPCINALASEYSNLRWRSFAMSLMVIGYPLGGVFGGLVARLILSAGAWQGVFHAGAIATSIFLPLVWFFVPESVILLDRRRETGALDRINRTLKRLGHEVASSLSDVEVAASRHTFAELLSPQFLVITALVTAAYFAHITSFYFILKWVPKMVVDLGFEPKVAAGVLTWANVGGALGGALFGLVAQRVGIRRATIFVLLSGALMVAWFGLGPHQLSQLTLTVAISGIFNNAAIAGLYMLFATVYPPELRASGTGFGVGFGRGGAALAPVLAGLLFQAGLPVSVVAPVMACGSVLAALFLLMLSRRLTSA
jgi:benzoate transport